MNCRISRAFVTMAVLISMACGNSQTLDNPAAGTRDTILVSLGQIGAMSDIEYDGSLTEIDLSLDEDVMKDVWVQVPYQSTCYRDVPDGYQTICETKYRQEQKCDYEQVCRQEQECRMEQRCQNEQQCRMERECRVETRCHPERVCENKYECRQEQKCTTRQECRNEQVCRDERKCEIIDGQRVCRIESVCENKQVCRPVQDCRNETVCETRPVCRTEQRCNPERVCEDVQKCNWVPVCRNEQVCNWVPRCNNEYVCRNHNVPYQDCRQEPKYREEAYSCTKTRPEKQQQLDYKHHADVKVVFDNVLLPQTIKDTFTVVVANGEVYLKVKDAQSGFMYYFEKSHQLDVTAPGEKTSTVVFVVKSIEPAAVEEMVAITDVEGTKRELTLERHPVGVGVDFKLDVRVRVDRVKPLFSTLIDRKLLPTEYVWKKATSKVQEGVISFKSLGLDKESAKRGDYEFEIELELVPLNNFEWMEPAGEKMISRKKGTFRS